MDDDVCALRNVHTLRKAIAIAGPRLFTMAGNLRMKDINLNGFVLIMNDVRTRRFVVNDPARVCLCLCLCDVHDSREWFLFTHRELISWTPNRL